MPADLTTTLPAWFVPGATVGYVVEEGFSGHLVPRNVDVQRVLKSKVVVDIGNGTVREFKATDVRLKDNGVVEFWVSNGRFQSTIYRFADPESPWFREVSAKYLVRLARARVEKRVEEMAKVDPYSVLEMREAASLVTDAVLVLEARLNALAEVQ